MGRTVVVVGGGYGGSLVAKALDPLAEVVLVDPREAFVNAAGSLRALTRPDWAPNIFFPFAKLLERGRFVRDSARSVDADGVTLASGGRIEADYLVLATGSGYPFPGKPSAATVDEALADLRRAHRELAGARSVLIVGSGPVGLELAGEITAVWPDKDVTVVGRDRTLLPGFLPDVRAELHRQLDERGVTLILGATASTPLPAADLTFRAHGVWIVSDYLADGKLTALTARATVPVTERLTVVGYDHVYALGDLADLPDPKMASYAQVQAEVVVENIKAQLTHERPAAVHRSSPDRRILLPLGPHGGVGQLPAPGGGAAAATPEEVFRRKGADLFTARFVERFAAR